MRQRHFTVARVGLLLVLVAALAAVAGCADFEEAETSVVDGDNGVVVVHIEDPVAGPIAVEAQQVWFVGEGLLGLRGVTLPDGRQWKEMWVGPGFVVYDSK